MKIRENETRNSLLSREITHKVMNWVKGNTNTLITLLRVPIVGPNRQYKASTAKMA